MRTNPNLKYPSEIEVKRLTKNLFWSIIVPLEFVGEWLNGRATVSKTVGCVFDSRLPCQKSKQFLLAFFDGSVVGVARNAFNNAAASGRSASLSLFRRPKGPPYASRLNTE